MKPPPLAARRPLLLLAAVCLLAACGTRPPDRTLDPPDSVDAELSRRYEAAVAAVDAGRYGDAAGRLERLTREAAGTELAPYVELQAGRVEAAADPIRGMNRLRALAEAQGQGPVAREARLYGGLAAARGEQCITARRLLGPLAGEDTPDARAPRALSRCEEGPKALALLDRAARIEPDEGDAARAQAIAATLPLDALAAAAERFADGPLAVPLARRLAEVARSADDRERLARALRMLPEGDPLAAEARDAVSRAPLGVILPLSGRSRPLGRDLEQMIGALYAEGEGRPESASIRVEDGGDGAKAAAAVRALADAGVFGAVGVFDSTSATAAARAAAEVGLPLVMLTLSDAPLRVEGPVWRALHTPTLVVRTAAGVGLGAGGEVAVVARGSDAFGKTHARLFAAAWQAGGGTVLGEIAWDAKKADYAAVAKQLAGARFDTLFVPADATGAAQLMRHLAAEGIWALGSKRRFEGEKGVREVRIIGTPSWYKPDLPRLGGRYVRGVSVPVPFAAETARGAPFAERVRAAAGRAPTGFDALLVDALSGLERGWAIHARTGDAAADSITRVGPVDGVSAGLDFGARDALPALFVLEVTADGFRLPE